VLEHILLVAFSVITTAGIGLLIRQVGRGTTLRRKVELIERRFIKRSDRTEGGVLILLDTIDIVLDVQLTILRCYKNNSCNGELTDAMDAVAKAKQKKLEFTNAATLAKKEPPITDET
jgi:hypothetical protein